MKRAAEHGDKIAISGFCFRNEYGGTDISNYDRGEKEKHDPNQYDGLAIVEIIKAWYDEETGWRYHGKPLNPALIAYLAKMNAIGRPKNGDDLGDEPRDADQKVLKDSVGPVVIFFSESDVDWIVTDQNGGFVNYKGE